MTSSDKLFKNNRDDLSSCSLIKVYNMIQHALPVKSAGVNKTVLILPGKFL